MSWRSVVWHVLIFYSPNIIISPAVNVLYSHHIFPLSARQSYSVLVIYSNINTNILQNDVFVA